jgi:zinc transporter ZupT
MIFPLYTTVILFLTTFASGWLVVWFSGGKRLPRKLLLAFSGAFLFTLSLVHLIPEVYAQGGKGVGVWVLGGFLLQLVLELFSEGLEHGHVHVHPESGRKFPWAVMLGLCLHAFLEGMPLVDDHNRNSLLIGLIIHNLPISMALVSLLLEQGLGRTRAGIALAVFAAMSPFGLSVAWLLLGQAPSPVVYARIMAVVIGIFLHISTTILFESSEQHRFNRIKFLSILAGCALALGMA